MFWWCNIVFELILIKYFDYEDFIRSLCGFFFNRYYRVLRWIKYCWFVFDLYDVSLFSRCNYGIIFIGFIEFVREFVCIVYYVLYLYVFVFVSNEIYVVRFILRFEG